MAEGLCWPTWAAPLPMAMTLCSLHAPDAVSFLCCFSAPVTLPEQPRATALPSQPESDPCSSLSFSLQDAAGGIDYLDCVIAFVCLLMGICCPSSQ